MKAKDKLLGLIGNPVKHSFSQDYFSKKFQELGLSHFRYALFELPQIEDLPALLTAHPQLIGLNVTLPYKKKVIPYLHELRDEAKKIGAVNTIKIEASGKLIGYNTDYLGFKQSLMDWIGTNRPHQSLVLGTGGASFAVTAALADLDIPAKLVSRKGGKGAITYEALKTLDLMNFPLIINSTPLGMEPDLETCPDLIYSQLNASHFAYDLVYNPEVTLFMEKARAQGAKVKNGLEMLHLQAENAWEIWTG